MNNYLNFCKKCIRGEIPYQKKIYVLDNGYNVSNDIKDKRLDVTVVTPTQQAVEQAKNEVKHELTINSAKKGKLIKVEVGEIPLRLKRRLRKKGDTKKNKKNGIKSKGRNGKVKKAVSKAKEKKKPKITSSYKAIWM